MEMKRLIAQELRVDMAPIDPGMNVSCLHQRAVETLYIMQVELGAP